MVGVRKDDDEQPQYDPHDPNQFFDFRVHHGGEFNGVMDEYIVHWGVDDIAAETCVDPTKIWDSLNVPNRPYEERASRSNLEDVSDELCSLEGSDVEEDIFRISIMAHAVRHRRDVKFQKNDQNRVRAFYSARDAVREIIDGAVKERYSKLREYAVEVMRMNLDTTILLNCDDNGRFQRMYICPKALKQGWKYGCMPLLGLDGCFKKGYHIRQLLTAIGVDGNNQWYPIAYALLADDLELNNSFGIVWISDKHKGLLDVTVERFPHSEYKFCVKHPYNKFKAQHRGLLLKQILWAAAKATIEQEFNQWMKKMKTESPPTYNWLVGKDVKHWPRAFFKDTALCDILCNNMCEAFNVAILTARDKPIITMMEMIRNYLMTRLVRKMAKLEKWSHEIGPKVFRFVENVKQKSVYYLRFMPCFRDVVREMIDGAVKERYSKLWEYVVDMMRMNLDTTILLNCDDNRRF
ncbi:hypothetical protein Dsin_002819 [Dipteronia sinensis]|uniref:MULE transposase domain-containing protein n=1 Tax=Dipteronia sinensis TaxID=43782 RepID=A0AAE0B6K0_9ROSI|nr:hypothetical protein Dsin_002819 [Dipteronia sinensis]